jgi:hypothetical protein
MGLVQLCFELDVFLNNYFLNYINIATLIGNFNHLNQIDFIKFLAWIINSIWLRIFLSIIYYYWNFNHKSEHKNHIM